MTVCILQRTMSCDVHLLLYGVSLLTCLVLRVGPVCISENLVFP